MKPKNSSADPESPDAAGRSAASGGKLSIPLEPFASARVVPGSQSIDSSLLSIAGFDPTGGAGVLADVKTFAAHEFFGGACITAMTVQTTRGVAATEPISAEIARKTLDFLTRDQEALRIAGVKIGMLGTGAMVGEVCRFLRNRAESGPKSAQKTLKNDEKSLKSNKKTLKNAENSSEIASVYIDCVVLDPVLRSSSGFELLDPAGQERLRGELLGLVDWVTPNSVELGWLLGLDRTGLNARTGAGRMELGKDREAVAEAARELQRMVAAARQAAERQSAGAGMAGPDIVGENIVGEDRAGADKVGTRGLGLNVVVTGGHRSPELGGPDDFLLTADGEEHWLAGEWVGDPADRWHGTGCAFSSALVANLASGLGPVEAVAAAKAYVAGAIRHGRRTDGAGLLEHFWRQR